MSETDPNKSLFRRGILGYIRSKNYQPLGDRALFKHLAIPVPFQSLCREILRQLVKEGILELRAHKYFLTTTKAERLIGVIRIHPKGFGFVESLSIPFQDIFIPKHLTHYSVDGDKVEVEVSPFFDRDKGPEGKIISIIERAHNRIVGTVHHLKDKEAFIYASLLGNTRMITIPLKKKTKEGDRVILKVEDWGSDISGPKGEILQIIGHISDPSYDIEAAMEEFQLKKDFSLKALEEAKALGDRVKEKDLQNREDYTSITTITIDPETAKDYDDALSIIKNEKGEYTLGVHIADVAHYVKAGSSLDLEALERGNSTYFPGYCLPMLPHLLSDQLCSLQSEVIRLTISVMMNFDHKGSLLNYAICRSYIKSSKRFSYEEAKAILDGPEKNPYCKDLKLMVELCLLLKNKRYERGSIDFSLRELVIVCDEKGKPYETKQVEYDISHQLVEEFMLKANEVVARHLLNQGRPAVFRIHEQPVSENVEDFYQLARSWGFIIPKEPTKYDLQGVFEKAKDTPYAQQLAIAFIRSMKVAFYSPENVGHYGLSLEHYCHFTSPIRRYTDLVIQRLLFYEEGKDLNLNEIAKKCSERERVSFKAESNVKTLKKFRLLKEWLHQNPQMSFIGIVTKIKPFGIFFEVVDLMLEGFLHISELENDYFIFNASTNTLVGQSSGKLYRIGESIAVRPLNINLILLESHWELILPKNRRRHAKKQSPTT